MILLKYCTRPRYVFIAFLTLVYSWYLGFLQFLCHSFFCKLVHLWITLVPTFLWGSFPLFTYAGDHNSCFNWILLCLIFCLYWLYECMKRIKAFVSFWAQLPKPNSSIYLVRSEHLLYPFEPCFFSSMSYLNWCLSMSIGSGIFVWMLLFLVFLNPQLCIVVWIFSLP